MKKTLTFIILTILCIFGVSAADAYTVSYTSVVTGPDGNMDMIMQVWAKDGVTRMDSSADGENFVVYTKEDGVYNYIPSQNLVTKMSQIKQKLDYVENPANYLGHLAKMGAKKMRREMFDKYPCDVYKYFDKVENVHVTVWVWTQKSFPVKLEINAEAGRKQVLFKDIQINQPISDNVFEVPQDAIYFDVTSLSGIVKLINQ